MAKFRLIAGQYVTNDTSKPQDQHGRYPDKVYNVPAIIESDEDLVLRHGADKFQYMDSVATMQNAGVRQVHREHHINFDEAAVEPVPEGLTNDELVALASEREVALTGDETREELIQKLERPG